MAITSNALTTNGNNVDATSFASASITPSSNTLVLAWVYSIAAAAPNIPTATGNGLTWVQVATAIESLRRITLFRSMGSSPSTGAVTFDFGVQTQTGAAWSIIEYANIDTSGTNGSGAIVQSQVNQNASNATSLTVTLGAFSDVRNGTVGGFGIPLNTAGLPDPGAAFTETGQRNQSTPNLSIFSEFADTNQTAVDSTWAPASVPSVGIAAEIKQAAQTIIWTTALV